jgi:CRP/FNR family transcriptional regulator, cyclic AMP receptor protein
MNTNIQLIHALKGSHIFRSLSPDDQMQLISFFRPRFFGTNETIFTQGEPGNNLYFIESGKVKVCTIGKNGAELVYSLLAEGDLLGEMAVFDGGPRSATAIAVESTQTLCLTQLEFMDMLRSSPETCIEIISLLCRRLRHTDILLEESAFLDASARLARKLLELAQSSSVCFISQEDLAGLLRISRVTVNKILQSYVDSGWIRISRRKIRLVNVEELHRTASYVPG